jgi:hypothetical protein
MANISRWDPFQDLLSLQMNQLFGQGGRAATSGEAGARPSVQGTSSTG